MLYSREYLEQRIKEEKFRSSRTGSPFSVVLFNPSGLVSEDGRGSVKDINGLIKILEAEARETDVKGWWNEKKVAVLLLDTPREKALLFINKLISMLEKKGHTPHELVWKADFQVFSFPNIPHPKTVKGDNEKKQPKRVQSLFSNPEFEKVNALVKFPGRNSAQPKERIKRIIDIMLSVAGMVFLLPVFMLCAVLIKIVSRGPVFFKQERVGYLGKPFMCWKFRTMKSEADCSIHEEHLSNLIHCDEAMTKLDEGRDPRIIPLGRFLRKTALDELPQLFNVLRGDMSLIGPRPCLPYEAQEYLLWQSKRFDTKPGLTGLWQVSGKNKTTFKEMMRFDIKYSKQRSFWLDLKIILKTVPAIFGQVRNSSTKREEEKYGRIS
jgi:lipopolysaccharide/colanic/teichoic acid biosynthesis glycosyltransferase